MSDAIIIKLNITSRNANTQESRLTESRLTESLRGKKKKKIQFWFGQFAAFYITLNVLRSSVVLSKYSKVCCTVLYIIEVYLKNCTVSLK